MRKKRGVDLRESMREVTSFQSAPAQSFLSGGVVSLTVSVESYRIVSPVCSIWTGHVQGELSKPSEIMFLTHTNFPLVFL